MTEKNMRRVSLEELRKLKDEREDLRSADAPEGEDLGAAFWAEAVHEYPSQSKSVHLRLDPEVFEYFRNASNGKGHLTRMQNVLKAYVKAHKAA